MLNSSLVNILMVFPISDDVGDGGSTIGSGIDALQVREPLWSLDRLDQP